MGQADTDALLEAQAKWREEIKEKAETPWFERAKGEFALRAYGGTRRVLMHRWADESGRNHRGEEVPWQDLATFDSYNDAEMVLRILQGGNE